MTGFAGKAAAIIASAILVGAMGAWYLFSGLYPVGADVPHTRAVLWLLQTLRERSIERASHDIVVPPLDDPQLLLSGGADYNDMCAGCHLKPGRKESDFSVGLYPRPPNLAGRVDGPGARHADEMQTARRRFWVIKHGIKASGMPAWGRTHDDQRIWAMVAFLRRLPELTPVQYQILTARKQPEPATDGPVSVGE